MDLLFGCCGGYFGRFACMLCVLRKSGTTRDQIYRKQFGGSDKVPFFLSGISPFMREAACCWIGRCCRVLGLEARSIF